MRSLVANSTASVNVPSLGSVPGTRSTEPFAPSRLTYGSVAGFPLGKVPRTSRARPGGPRTRERRPGANAVHGSVILFSYLNHLDVRQRRSY
jgi:hypothetical protein